MIDIDNPPAGFSFSVRLAASDPTAAAPATFQEISGLTTEIETDEVSEGGENRYLYRLPKPKPLTVLVLRRGRIGRNSPLYDWVMGSTSGFAPVSSHDVLVQLIGADGNPVVSWTVRNAVPLQLTIAQVDSRKDDVVSVERLEFSFDS